MAKRVIPQGPGIDELPPPGDERREVLRERTDELAEKIETNPVEIERADPRAFRVENELAQHFNELEVSNSDPNYRYCWVNSSLYGRFVKMKLAEGWEVVQGDMQEAVELKGMGADTTRRLGDVILMRIQLDRYRRLQRASKARRESQNLAVEGSLRQTAEKYADRGVVLHTDLSTMNPQTLKTLNTRSTAARVATQMTDQWLREGRMPGQPAPRG